MVDSVLGNVTHKLRIKKHFAKGAHKQVHHSQWSFTSDGELIQVSTVDRISKPSDLPDASLPALNPFAEAILKLHHPGILQRWNIMQLDDGSFEETWEAAINVMTDRPQIDFYTAEDSNQMEDVSDICREHTYSFVEVSDNDNKEWWLVGMDPENNPVKRPIAPDSSLAKLVKPGRENPALCKQAAGELGKVYYSHLSDKQKAIMFLQVAHTLQFIHKHGFVHGDVSPNNIAIGLNNKAKLLDFDLAGENKVSKKPLDGTPLFLCPYDVKKFMQAESQATNPEARDIWALAVSMMYCFELDKDLINEMSDYFKADANLVAIERTLEKFKEDKPELYDLLKLVLVQDDDTRIANFKNIGKHAFFKKFDLVDDDPFQYDIFDLGEYKEVPEREQPEYIQVIKRKQRLDESLQSKHTLSIKIDYIRKKIKKDILLRINEKHPLAKKFQEFVSVNISNAKSNLQLPSSNEWQKLIADTADSYEQIDTLVQKYPEAKTYHERYNLLIELRDTILSIDKHDEDLPLMNLLHSTRQELKRLTNPLYSLGKKLETGEVQDDFAKKNPEMEVTIYPQKEKSDIPSHIPSYKKWLKSSRTYYQILFIKIPKFRSHLTQRAGELLKALEKKTNPKDQAKNLEELIEITFLYLNRGHGSRMKAFERLRDAAFSRYVDVNLTLEEQQKITAKPQAN